MIKSPCYIGKTNKILKTRFIEHRSKIIHSKEETILIKHCREINHPITSLKLMGIEQVSKVKEGIERDTMLLQRESYWIFMLNTV
ncbi:hypothetical protein FKM82_018678 [Ascaphus truei]